MITVIQVRSAVGPNKCHWKKVKVKFAQLSPTLCNPMEYIVHGILQARILKWVAFPFYRGFPSPGIKPRSPTLQVDSLPPEPQGKPKNTRVGSLPLLQQIFPTQELNRGLLHFLPTELSGKPFITLGMGNRNKMWFDRYLSQLTGRLWKWENDLMAKVIGNGGAKDGMMFPTWHLEIC